MSLFNIDKNKGSDSKRFLEFYLGKESRSDYADSRSPSYVCGMINPRGLVLTVLGVSEDCIRPVPDAQGG